MPTLFVVAGRREDDAWCRLEGLEAAGKAPAAAPAQYCAAVSMTLRWQKQKSSGSLRANANAEKEDTEY